ncbi:hypothetical protein [Psychromonas sp. L1A2]|uniref:hypothetical protein n=1 Tax=Psychromonas sp. L1A2 TaxID=2686356 RepID=UPI00135951B2|nr:hypothetical protein [Psychromonas sp. L1A2]
MYLNVLTKNERKDFLNLAKHSMSLNGQIKEEEEEIYHSFVHECELHGYQAKVEDEHIRKSISAFSTAERTTKHAVLIELFGILLADEEICEAERKFMDKLTIAFDFAEYEVKKIERWVLSMNDLVREGYRMVGG